MNHHYQYSANGHHAHASPAILFSASDIRFRQACQLSPQLQLIVAQNGRATPPYGEGSWQHQIYTPGQSVGGFVPQAHHMQRSISPVYAVPHQHQPMSMWEICLYPPMPLPVDLLCEPAPTAQAQAALNASFRGDIRQPATAPQSKSKKLFIHNLPSSFIEDELRDMFSVFGIVTRASIVRHKTGKTLYAFVKFMLQESADNAIKMMSQRKVSMM